MLRILPFFGGVSPLTTKRFAVRIFKLNTLNEVNIILKILLQKEKEKLSGGKTKKNNIFCISYVGPPTSALRCW